MSKVNKFPLQGDSAARWAAPIFITFVGACLIVYGIFEEGALYFGLFIFIPGVLMLGVKRNVTIDTATGSITSEKGFYFFTNKEMFNTRDFTEVYVRRSRVEGQSKSVRDNYFLFYVVLNGRCMMTVDSFGDREGARHWQKELAEALQLKLGEDRNEHGALDRFVTGTPDKLSG